MAFMIRSRISLWARQQFIPRTSSSLLFYSCCWQNSVSGLACTSIMAFKHFSSSVDSSPLPFTYVPIEEVEPLEKYQPGGYHPILIGDVLHSRYRVAHKLGYGAYSTTWLCRDYRSNSYVAVKVGTANSSDREVDILDYLNHSTPFEHPGKTMISSIKERFVLHGPNGTHPCYVTTLVIDSSYEDTGKGSRNVETGMREGKKRGKKGRTEQDEKRRDEVT
ncbi:unnamed protein product [Penicillium olsonii]|nr:unnamed protein product [Penicillium olsonii]CAG7922546.1 unnamed protein product [Penicillium olsonii]